MLSYTNHGACTHAHSRTSKITRIRFCSILKFATHKLISSCMHPPITIKMNWVNYLFFPYRTIPLLAHVKKITWLFPFWLIPSQIYVYDFKTPTSTSPIIWCPNKYYTKPCLPDYKIPRILCSLLPTVHTIHIHHTQHTHLTPIIHNILSKILHMSNHHPIKNHHNSQTS